jgi:hypothetical protein
VGEVGVNGAANDLSADGSEILGAVTELNDLGRAHEGEVEGPEEKHDILAYSSTFLRVNIQQICSNK